MVARFDQELAEILTVKEKASIFELTKVFGSKKEAFSLTVNISTKIVFICLQEICGIDIQDKMMDEMKNIHFNFKKTRLFVDFDDFGPESLPYKVISFY